MFGREYDQHDEADVYNYYFSLHVISCADGKMPKETVSNKSIKDISSSTWKNLAQKTIYFGHQSVGVNIIDIAFRK
jgi:hypothetical protein